MSESTLWTPPSKSGIDKYIGMGGHEYVRPGAFGYVHLEIAEFLKGRPWDDKALACLNMYRPSKICVTRGEQHTDWHLWRIHVAIDESEVITHVSQEVEIALAGDWGNGLDASAYIKRSSDS